MTKIHFYLAAVLAVLIGLYAYNYYTQTPEYVANRNFEAGVAALAEMNLSDGIAKLVSAAHSHTSVSGKARLQLKALLDDDYLALQNPENIVLVLRSLQPAKGSLPDYVLVTEEYALRLENDHPFHSGQLVLIAAHHIDDPRLAEVAKTRAHTLLSAHLGKVAESKSLATEYAVLDEKFNACVNCAKVLEPHIAQLGDSVGARILGQYYAANGKVAEAFELLQPYTETRLDQYRQAEAAYSKALDQAWSDTITYLDNGNAPESFYQAYEEADEATQSQLVNEFYSNMLDKNVLVKQALEVYEQTAAIVPVALDLGIVRLGRAMSMASSALRQAELSAAEKMFLAVRSYAGNSDDYQLYLGQVYYWLGKDDEGQQLFHELIEKYGRSPAVLSSIASVLRDLGAKSTAKAYVEEAYNATKDTNEKQQYAYQKYLLADELDERIEWLEKSDTSQLYVQADLYSAKAARAERNNEVDTALALYQKSIDVYNLMPEQTSAYNNMALVYMGKFQLGKNESDFDMALTYMDKAVNLSPDDSIVLSNAADYYGLRAYREILKSRINLSVLEQRASIDLFPYFYNNETEKQQLIEELKNSEFYPKLVEYTRKAMLLAPKDIGAFSKSYILFYFLRDETEIASLVQRISHITVNDAESLERLQQYRLAETDKEDIEKVNEAIALSSKKYQHLDAQKNPLEYTVVSVDSVEMQLSLAERGENIASAEIFDKTKAIYQQFPCSATRSIIIEAAQTHFIAQARRQSSAFEDFYQRFNRIMNGEYLIGFAAQTLPGFVEQFSSDPMLQQYLRLMQESEDNFPSQASSTRWFVFHSFGLDYAKNIQARYKESTLAPYILKISTGVTANQEYIVLANYINLLILGRDEEAQTTLQRGLELGLSIPSFVRL